jgi:hypothetical protein
MNYNSKIHYLKDKYKCCDKKKEKPQCNNGKKYPMKKQRVSNLKIGHREKDIHYIKRIYPYFKSIINADGTFNIDPIDHARSSFIHKKSMDYIIACRNETNIESKSFENCKEIDIIHPFEPSFIRTEKLYERFPYNYNIVNDDNGVGDDDDNGVGDDDDNGVGDDDDNGGIDDDIIDELVNELSNVFIQYDEIDKVKCYGELPESVMLKEYNVETINQYIDQINKLFNISDMNG